MDYKEIEKLLDRYFEGESRQEDEQVLNAYFNGPEVHEDLRSYQPLFQYYRQEQSLRLDDAFDQRLMQQLSQVEQTTFKRRNLYPLLARIAAVVVFATGVFYGIYQMNQDEVGFIKPSETTVAEEITPEEAYREVMAALTLVSSKLNKGQQKAMEGISKIDKATKVLK